ncbi:winged helix-turn-helix domain-containing protein [Tumebacillus permanentifrigoris]|uniref:winged helix-turn-helix domain-containing protein n=1 Tax=Tumebacillus permanentifrigoris TaxID=378543 RepID=UPI000D6CD5E0|nr:winged helix-turn-helix domain-containing protein [Tumebacillus permanentifrigoris]
MAHLHFQADAWSVTYKGTRITLLPKEYALLDFLYRNQGHAFTRDELLDRVWPLESPVDRPVDDHIYRLRKKLKSWSEVITLDTVRSVGYRMTMKKGTPVDDCRSIAPRCGGQHLCEQDVQTLPLARAG